MPDGSRNIAATALPERTTALPGRTVVVMLPGEADVSNEAEIREMLAAALATRPEVVIADGTRTDFCDCAAVAALIVAYQRAATAGIELRVVITSPRVHRVLELIGVEQVLAVYPSLEAAQADGNGRTRA